MVLWVRLVLMVLMETTGWLDSLVLGMAVLLLLRRLLVVFLFMATWLDHMRHSR